MSVAEEMWNYQIDLSSIEKRMYVDFDSQVNSTNECILKLLDDSFKGPKFCENGNKVQCYDEELKNVIESNKQIRSEIDTKLLELSQQQIQYEKYKKDQKLLSQEIKETHEAFLMAKKYYKKFLKLYYTIEAKSGDKQTIFVQFFTEAKKESENYSARLMRDTKTGCYQLLSTSPKLYNQNELQRKLLENNDVPGLMCCLRQAFAAIKQNKN